MSLAQAATVLGGELRGSDVRFSSVCTDSRTLKSGDLFVALRGERYDGHDFVAKAAAAGAVAALIDRAHAPAATAGTSRPAPAATWMRCGSTARSSTSTRASTSSTTPSARCSTSAARKSK